MILLFYNPLFFLMLNLHVEKFCLVALLVCLLIQIYDLYSLGSQHLLVMTVSFLWSNFSSIYVLLNHNVPLSSTIASILLVLYVSLVMTNILYLLKKNYFFNFMSSFFYSYFSLSSTIVLNSSWIISRSINAWDIRDSILRYLLLASETILWCFFFWFLVIFNSFFIIPVFKKIQE